MNHAYTFKGTIYFRKRISYKILVNRDTDLLYRRSLRKCVDKNFYFFLECNNTILDKLISFLNKELSKRLKQGKPMSITDISDYISELCRIYKKEALKEDCPLEDKRIEGMEFIDDDGNVHPGYLLQAISREYKLLWDAYNDMYNLSKIIKLGNRILKRTNIDTSKILELSEANKNLFFQSLIKSEKDVLENDIRNYIARNFSEFRHLCTKDLTGEDKINEATYSYIDLIIESPLQKDYKSFLRSFRTNSINVQALSTIDSSNRKESAENVLNEILEQQKNILEQESDPMDLINEYIDHRKITKESTKKNTTNAIKLFIQYIKGDGINYQRKNIYSLTSSDIKEFEDLIADCMPKDRKRKDLTIFETVKLREELNFFRYEENTLKNTAIAIKKFYKTIPDFKKIPLDMSIFDDFDPLAALNEKNLADERPNNVLRAFYVEELQKIIDEVFSKNELFKILRDTPEYFYAFCFNLFLGTRINEFYRVKIDSIKVQEKIGEKIYYIWLNENDPKQSLKNQNAHRNIIISNILIELGFINYLNKIRADNEEWLWKQNDSGYGSISTFFNRKIAKLFPNSVYSIDNRLKTSNSLIQMRCLRKNFAERTFEEDKTPHHTEQNNKRLMGHEEGTSTGEYLGRLEPYIGKIILDANEEDYGLDLTVLKNDVKEYYKDIETEVNNLRQIHTEDWKEKSPVRPRTIRRGRKS